MRCKSIIRLFPLLFITTILFLSCLSFFDQDIERRLEIQQEIYTYKAAILTYKKDEELKVLNAWDKILSLTMEDDYFKEQSLEAAHKCLELLDKKSINNIDSDIKSNIIRDASNTIVWYEYETATTQQLEKLLLLINRGCDHSNMIDHAYIFDTKVRLLLKLGKTEEAYCLVRECILKNRHNSYFDDIKNNKEFIKWRRNLEANMTIEFSESEKKELLRAKRIHLKLLERLSNEKNKPQTFVEKIPKKIILSYQEAIKKYNIEKNILSHKNLEDDILVFTGDVHIKGELNDQWFENQLNGMKWENDLYGMLIVGNLVIDGDLNDDNYIELYVTKDLKCDYVFSYNGYIHVIGNADIKYGAYGEYNDGSIFVEGTTHTPYCITDDHFMNLNIGTYGIRIYAGEGRDREYINIETDTEDGYLEDPQKLFNPAVWDKETDTFSVKQFFDLVRQGKNPFIEF